MNEVHQSLIDLFVLKTLGNKTRWRLMTATGLRIPLAVAGLLAALLAAPAQAQNGDGNAAASTGILPLLDYSGSLWERSYAQKLCRYNYSVELEA